MTPIEGVTEEAKAMTIIVPNAKELEVRSGSLTKDIEALVVKDTESHARALTLWSEADTVDKAIVERFDEQTSAANKIHKFLTGLREMLRAPLVAAKSLARRKANDWAEEERLRAEKEARELAEKARQEEEERQLAEAVEAEAQGDKATAEAILETPVEAPYVPPAPKLAKVEGVSERANYKAQVTDLMALVRYVVANPGEVNLLAANQPALNQRAKSMRKEGQILPGVQGVKETVLAQRRA